MIVQGFQKYWYCTILKKIVSILAIVWNQKTNVIPGGRGTDFWSMQRNSYLSEVFVDVFSPSGKLLVFLSCQAAVNSGVHTATNSLHSISWPGDAVLSSPIQIKDVVQFSTSYCFRLNVHTGFVNLLVGTLLDCWELHSFSCFVPSCVV